MHKSAAEAAAAYQSQIKPVINTTRPWMGLLMHITPDGVLHLERTTSGFPMGRIGDALELMKQDAAMELGLVDQTPLPLAPGFGIVAEDEPSPAGQPQSIAEAVGEA